MSKWNKKWRFFEDKYDENFDVYMRLQSPYWDNFVDDIIPRLYMEIIMLKHSDPNYEKKRKRLLFVKNYLIDNGALDKNEYNWIGKYRRPQKEREIGWKYK